MKFHENPNCGTNDVRQRQTDITQLVVAICFPNASNYELQEKEYEIQGNYGKRNLWVVQKPVH